MVNKIMKLGRPVILYESNPNYNSALVVSIKKVPFQKAYWANRSVGLRW